MVIAVTRSAQAARQAHLFRGVFPVLYSKPPEAIWADDVDHRVQFGIESGEPPRFPPHPALGLRHQAPDPTFHTHSKGLASLLWSQIFPEKVTKTPGYLGLREPGDTLRRAVGEGSAQLPLLELDGT